MQWQWQWSLDKYKKWKPQTTGNVISWNLRPLGKHAAQLCHPGRSSNRNAAGDLDSPRQ